MIGTQEQLFMGRQIGIFIVEGLIRITSRSLEFKGI
jgi:hypothetical protein